MRKRNVLLFLTMALLLVAFNRAVWQKESQLREGTVMYLRLAPVDPRAFMLGDYMALAFTVDTEISRALRAMTSEGPSEGLQEETRKAAPREGQAVVALSDKGVASFQRFVDGGPLSDNEHLLHFRLKNGSAHVAAEAFFFQEGHAKDYEAAQYGEIRVDAEGKTLLVHLLNADMQRIQPGSAK